MVDMPKELGRCRLQLMIEYNRLLAWGDAVGLVEVRDGSNLASSLGTNAIELCSVVARIGELLEEFKDLNDRWKEETSLHQEIDRTMAEKIDYGVQVSGLALTYEKNREKRKPSKGLHHIMAKVSKRAGNAREVITHPIRARWVMVDKLAFEVLLNEIHGLIERIHELMRDYRGRQMHETTAKTYREMVVVRNDLCELKDMFQAVIHMMEISTRSSTGNLSQHEETNTNFRDLLLLKQIKCISDEISMRIKNDTEVDITEDLKDVINVNQYDGALFGNHFAHNSVESINGTLDLHRLRGVLTKEGEDHEVWVEWREVENVVSGSKADKESLLRTATLAQMLSINKPQHLFTPTCIGYVDDRQRKSQTGWVFEMPLGSHSESLLKTLHSMLGVRSCKPTLALRVSLAWKLATSLMCLHTADWLHKGVHSGNVLFCCDEESFDFEKPILSGFEYSRPQSNRTTSRSLDPKWDIYRWPGIQNEVPRAENSRKTYDIYSLGLLLLEIAHWQPLNELMSLKRWPSPSAQDCRIRGWLLEEECLPPFKHGNPLLELRNIAGDKYWEATRHCIVAHGEHGMRVKEDSDQSRPDVGFDLQAAFTELVVDRLKTVSV